MFGLVAADLVLSAGILIIIFSLTSSIHDHIGLSRVKQTDGYILSIRSAYGFTDKPSGDNNNSNQNLTLEKYQQIKDIQDSGLPFAEYIHKISISARNPQNTSAVTDYKIIQKHMEKIEKSINVSDIKESDFMISSNDALDLCPYM